MSEAANTASKSDVKTTDSKFFEAASYLSNKKSQRREYQIYSKMSKKDL